MGASTAKTKGRLSPSITCFFWGCRCSVSFRQEKIEFRFFFSFFFLVCRSKVHAELLIPPVQNDMKTHYVFVFFLLLISYHQSKRIINNSRCFAESFSSLEVLYGKKIFLSLRKSLKWWTDGPVYPESGSTGTAAEMWWNHTIINRCCQCSWFRTTNGFYFLSYRHGLSTFQKKKNQN